MTSDVQPSISGSSWNYVVTAHKPTAVTHALVGNFTAATELNLIIGKAIRLEVHTVTSEGLKGVVDVPIYGRISHLELFRPSGRTTDLLFLLTEQLNFCVLEYESSTGTLKTAANGELKDLIRRKRDEGDLCVIDPKCRLICLCTIKGSLKVVPMNPQTGLLSEPFNIRIEHLTVLDLVFLANYTEPTIAMLVEDRDGRHVEFYEVGVEKKVIERSMLSGFSVDASSHRLVPVPEPVGGVIVVSDKVLLHLHGEHMKSLPIPHNNIVACGRIDTTRYLLGDWTGGLHLLVLLHDDKNAVTELKLEPLGVTSAASCLTYLDNGVVFVGSTRADSQLIRLLDTSADQPANYVEVLDTFVHLGPIFDFAVVDLERQGQGQIVTCSNVHRDGTLRVVRNGIGINEQASVVLEGIKGVWSLRRTWMDAYDTYLVLTFVAETHVLGLTTDEELEEFEIPGFEGGTHTLLCANMASDHFVQVTGSSARLVDCGTQQMVHCWMPPAGVTINVAASSPTQVVLGASGGHLVYLEVVDGMLVEKKTLKLEQEIACVDISPMGSNDEVSQLLVLGTWGLTLQLLTLPDLHPVAEEPLQGEVIPRSVLLTEFEGLTYVLCGLGDGVLHTWRLDSASGSLGDKKKLALGTKPLQLRTFKVNGNSHVLAASDRPTVIHSANKKLLYSNLNENDVGFISSFNTANFPDSLAMAKEETLIIGTVDQIQKLHIRTVPLREQPRRICHQDTTNTFGVLTQHVPPGQAVEECYLRILDDQSFEALASFQLDTDPHEAPTSLCSMRFGDETEYYVVGTAYIRSDEPEPSEGRIIVLQYSGGGKLELMASTKVKGAVYSLVQFQGKILASYNNFVGIFIFEGSTITCECSRSVQVIALSVAARGDHIIVGDYMRSVSLLIYKPDDKQKLELRGRDLNPSYTSAISMLDDDTYLFSDNSLNLHVVRKNAESALDEERHNLQVCGLYHLGSFVNRFREGSLVMRLPDSELSSLSTTLFATLDGIIGVVATLPNPWFQFLSKLESALRTVIKGVGGFDHVAWRAYKDELRTETSQNFIDGDLIEQFLELPAASMQEVATRMGDGVKVEELCKKVEELTRLH